MIPGYSCFNIIEKKLSDKKAREIAREIEDISRRRLLMKGLGGKNDEQMEIKVWR